MDADVVIQHNLSAKHGGVPEARASLRALATKVCLTCLLQAENMARSHTKWCTAMPSWPEKQLLKLRYACVWVHSVLSTMTLGSSKRTRHWPSVDMTNHLCTRSSLHVLPFPLERVVTQALLEQVGGRHWSGISRVKKKRRGSCRRRWQKAQKSKDKKDFNTSPSLLM